MKLAQAVCLGNTCVLKPSEYTPSSLYRFVEILHAAGMPEGVVNLVNGRGEVTGRALTEHPAVDRIAFTGGTVTGRMIMQAGSRILVQRSIADDFIERFAARSKRIVVGDPRDPATEIGPLCHREHFERVCRYAKRAAADGERLVCGGGPSPGFDKGFYFAPTAFVARSNASQIARDEIFGPFATILTFDDVDEAIALANDSEFGLVAYAWTEDLATALRVRDEVRAGTVWINSPLMRDLHAPFGGYKHSGVGRTGGLEGLRFFAETKTASVAKRRLPLRKLGACD